MHHHKWKEIVDTVSKPTKWKIIGDQVLTKSPVESEINSIRGKQKCL